MKTRTHARQGGPLHRIRAAAISTTTPATTPLTMKRTLASPVLVNSTEKTQRTMPSWIARNFAYDICLPCAQPPLGEVGYQDATSGGGNSGPWANTASYAAIRMSSSGEYGVTVRPVRPLPASLAAHWEIPLGGMVLLVVGDQSRERASGP